MGRGVRRFGSLAEFSRDRRSGGGRFLSGWKEHGSIDVWLHTKALPLAVYRHQLPTIVIKEDRNDKRVKHRYIWSKNFVCHETDKVVESQHFREEDGGRKHPPERCGLCKLVEWCYQQAVAYEDTRDLPPKKREGISWTTPLFRWEGEDKDGNPITQVIHVGGICNLFNKTDKQNDRQKEDLRESKISLKRAWQENGQAKCQYVMFVVDDAHPETGVQLAVEGQSLGEKVKKRLSEELEENEIDITKSPYCLRWKYNERETNLNEKYSCAVVRKKKPVPRVLKLIRGEVPELPDDLTVPFNQTALRATLEAACVLPEGTVPWAELFPSREQIVAWRKEDEEAEREEEAARAAEAAEDEAGDDEDDDDADDDDDAADEDDDDDDDADDDEDDADDEDADAEEDEDDDAEDDADEEEMVMCSHCEQPMKATAEECACGARYVSKDGKIAMIPPPEKVAPPKADKPLRRRGEAPPPAAEGTAKPAGEKAGKKAAARRDGLPF